MPVVSKEEIANARKMDLLSYLRAYEPGELVRFSGETYCTRTHDSLKISNGKWYWFSQNIGGRSALDYLVKVKEMSFPEAVKMLNGQAVQPICYEKPPPRPAGKSGTAVRPPCRTTAGRPAPQGTARARSPRKTTPETRPPR